RYADVAELGSKFCKLKNLKLAASTLYALVEHDNEDDLPSIIEELARHASKKQLSIRDAEHVIRIGIGRHRYGDHPDATLVQLVEIEQYRDSSWYDKAVAELKEQKPETDESAYAIVDEVEQEYLEAERIESKAAEDAMLLNLALDLEAKEKAQQEAESILDGPPPVLPPPITPPEPQKLGAGTAWAETE